jgi:hypothetical protein
LHANVPRGEGRLFQTGGTAPSPQYQSVSPGLTHIRTVRDANEMGRMKSNLVYLHGRSLQYILKLFVELHGNWYTLSVVEEVSNDNQNHCVCRLCPSSGILNN